MNAVSRRMPPSIRSEVAARVLRRALDANWEDLPQLARSSLFEEWSRDPDIGGVIAQYVPQDRVRLWIKDGPIKGYQRARMGLGPYAKYLPQTVPAEEAIASRLPGGKWVCDPNSISVKPSRFIARKEEQSLEVLWGTTTELKHLIWHWLKAESNDSMRLVVVSTSDRPVTREIREQCERISARLGTPILVVFT